MLYFLIGSFYVSADVASWPLINMSPIPTIVDDALPFVFSGKFANDVTIDEGAYIIPPTHLQRAMQYTRLTLGF